MALTYDAPQDAAVVAEEISNDVGISQEMQNAMYSILDLDNPSTEVNVAVMDEFGVIIQKPADTTNPELQMITVNIDKPEGETVFVPISPELTNNKVWIFSTDANINVRFNTTERVINMGNGDDTVAVFGDRNTTLSGADGNDFLFTTAGSDSITGGAGNDYIIAGQGNDTIVSGQGTDTVSGGTGFDVMQVAGSVNDWLFSVDGQEVEMAGLQGSNNLVFMSGVNFISFGTPVEQNGDQFSVVITDAGFNKDDAMRLYQTALDRSGDQAGAQYWLDQIDSGTESFVNVAASFLQSAEYADQYGVQTNTQFVEQLYQNAFDRAADQPGLNYWLNELNTGTSRAQVLASIASSTEASESISNVIVVTGFI